MDTKVFEERLREWNVPFAIIADLETGNAIRVGCSTGLEFDDLVNTLFRDAEAILATSRYLEGQILPRIWNQGQESCVLCKPNDQTLVGLFLSDQRNPVEKYRWFQQLNSGVVNAFARA